MQPARYVFLLCNTKGGLGHEAMEGPAERPVSLGEAKSDMSQIHAAPSCSVGVGHWHTSLGLRQVLPNPGTSELAELV